MVTDVAVGDGVEITGVRGPIYMKYTHYIHSARIVPHMQQG